MSYNSLFLILVFIAKQIADKYIAQASSNMLEEGRSKYQYLQQMSELPQYGTCWKSAVEHVENGCRVLSEEMQSNIALRITNCFLEMSGHDTYNCEFDKKRNLRKICIMSMSDRAFNVYTEFFTHTQNICWFLRGQVWYETMNENTLRVSKQMETSANNQENILKSQRESLYLQENLLRYGQNLEKIMKDFHASSKLHEETLSIMSQSLGGLHSWLIGELSWFDLVIFYLSAVVLIGILTSTHRTVPARLPILFLLMANAVVERCICNSLMSNVLEDEVHLVHKYIYKYIWWSRKVFITFAILILLYTAFTYCDLQQVNNTLLQKIYEQNVNIFKSLEMLQNKNQNNDSVSFIYENTNGIASNNVSIIGPVGYEKSLIKPEGNDDIKLFKSEKKKFLISDRKASPFPELYNNESLRYNLRSRQSTPVYV